MSVIQTPVLIVGAGPAGVATSIFLSKAGISHYIVDQASFPRDKVCGDGFTGHSLDVLEAAGISWKTDVSAMSHVFHPAYGLTFSAPNGKMLDIPFHNTGPDGNLATCFTASRLEFDNYLFQKIDKQYATVLEACTVKTIQKTDTGYQVTVSRQNTEENIAATIIVGADGDKSVVRKLLASNTAPVKTNCIALRGYYTGVSGIEQQRNLELHFIPELSPGYLWIFAMPGGRANVGIGMLSKDARKRKINLRQVMQQALTTNPILAPRFRHAVLEGKMQGWGLPMCMKQLPISGDGLILTGDAAQLIDPFSGEGIGNALYSGMIAAQAIKAAIEKNDTTAANLARLYDQPVYQKLWPGIRRSLFLQKANSSPALFNMVLNKAHKSATLRNAITGMFTTNDLAHLLWSPKFYARVLLNR